MSEPRETQGSTWGQVDANKNVQSTLTVDEREYKARIATILDRGITTQRLALPPGVDPMKHYEFHSLDSLVQADARTLGFVPAKIQIDGDSPQSLHCAADGTYVVGDVMLMEIPKNYKKIIDQVYRERIEAKHGKPGQVNKNQVEERTMKNDFSKSVGLPTIDEPSLGATPVNLEEIRQAVKTQE